MENVKPKSVPQIKGLRVEDFVNFIVNEVDNGVDYLPENYKEVALNRQWIVNLCKYFLLILLKGNSFNEEGFKTMITEAIKEREQFIISKNSMIITIDSRIVEALNSLSMLSSMNIYIMIK